MRKRRQASVKEPLRCASSSRKSARWLVGLVRLFQGMTRSPQRSDRADVQRHPCVFYTVTHVSSPDSAAQSGGNQRRIPPTTTDAFRDRLFGDCPSPAAASML